MIGLNKVILVGRLGADVDVKVTKGGKGKMATLNVATDNSYRASDGTWVDQVDWHRVVTYQSGLIDGVLEKHARKGRVVTIEGTLKSRKWEKDGEAQYITEVVIENNGAVSFMDKFPSNGGSKKANEA